MVLSHIFVSKGKDLVIFGKHTALQKYKTETTLQLRVHF
jgi:hypothetical protein